MKKHLSTIALVVVLVAGVGLLLYPTLSDYWNSLHQSRAIASYTKAVSNTSEEDYSSYWQEAKAYNEALWNKPKRLTPTEEERAYYHTLLDASGLGILGYIEIPKIKVALPLYHGVSDAVLQIAVGHIEGSSLPTGGPGTHAVFSGHRGLPSARLFTDLDQLEAGDLFFLRVLNEVLTYEVDQILIVLPKDVSALGLVEGEDLCTLVTCTPYGVNSHRLLVRGHRVETPEEEPVIHVSANALQVDPILVVPFVAGPMLLVLFIILLVRTGKKKK